MLTLTRKPGESIHIGDDIEIVVKEIRGGAVRLGIQAPSKVFIYRGELYRKVKFEGYTGGKKDTASKDGGATEPGTTRAPSALIRRTKGRKRASGKKP